MGRQTIWLNTQVIVIDLLMSLPKAVWRDCRRQRSPDARPVPHQAAWEWPCCATDTKNKQEIGSAGTGSGRKGVARARCLGGGSAIYDLRCPTPESHFSEFKEECIYLHDFATLEEASEVTGAFIESYSIG